MSFSTSLIRTVGLATVGLAAYEVNHMSKEYAVYKTRENTAAFMTDLYMKHNINSDGSMHTENMKAKYREFIMNDNYITNFRYFKNRILGFGEGLLENCVSIGLGAAAIMSVSTSKNSIYKGLIPKPLAGACAAVAVLFGATNFYKNVLGMGHSNPNGFYP